MRLHVRIQSVILDAGSLGGSNSVVECQLPKLDVVGSSPISRSNFSITYGKLNFSGNPLFEVTG